MNLEKLLHWGNALYICALIVAAVCTFAIYRLSTMITAAKDRELAQFRSNLLKLAVRLQVLTIADLFNGKQPNIPMIDPSVFKRAAKESVGDQHKLPL